MNKEFQVHLLNSQGVKKAKQIAAAFDALLDTLAAPASPTDGEVICPPSRELSIVKTKLEEACFFAKKAMASAPANCLRVDEVTSVEA